jgi:predicted DNA-binding protein (MmcQ/YjbR family)
MNIEDLRDFCLSLYGASECFPFDETTLVFKVGGKMFCLTDLEGDFFILLKNTPENIVRMQEEHPAVKPGYHMNKKYWNMVVVDGSVQDELIRDWIAQSYNCVVEGLPNKKKQELKHLGLSR